MKKLIFKNIPNALSAYRILMVPVIAVAIYTQNKRLFFVLIMVNLVTDILDGLIARRFNLQTDFGAKLDSTADVGTYLCAIAGFVVLEPEFIAAYIHWFIVLVGLYALAQIIAILKFGRNTHYHLYSNKITGYLQGIFFLLYFLSIFIPWYFYFMMIFSYLAYTESIIVTVCIKKLRSNVQGIYFMLKKHGSIK